MTEDELWKVYKREVAEMERLEGDFLNASDGENQIAALARVEHQSGRLEIVRELLTTQYARTEFMPRPDTETEFVPRPDTES